MTYAVYSGTQAHLQNFRISSYIKVTGSRSRSQEQESLSVCPEVWAPDFECVHLQRYVRYARTSSVYLVQVHTSRFSGQDHSSQNRVCVSYSRVVYKLPLKGSLVFIYFLSECDIRALTGLRIYRVCCLSVTLTMTLVEFNVTYIDAFVAVRCSCPSSVPEVVGV